MKPAMKPAVNTARTEMSDAAVVSRSWGMAFATLISRITGFIRIVLLAAILGAALSSAFTVANQLPNLVAALVLEATFTAIFVPVLARAERDDADGGEAFVRRLVTLATTVLLVATILSVAAAPVLVRLMLGNDPQVNNPLTTAFAYLLLPQVIFYGLSSVFMAILNNRNVFGAPAWAPVINNVVAIATLGLYVAMPGELSVDPVRMGNAKLLVLGIGTTLGVVAQAAVLFVAIRKERVSLRPLWGIDDRLKRFGAMAAAMVLYVLISQIGLIVGNQIASSAAASGPAIYNYTWLMLQLPFGIIGVTVLTVVMPRLSRNAAANDTPAVLGDLNLATRLTMVTLIPVVALMTVGGPAMGSALFAYGKFGQVDANYLGMAIALSAFTLVPYALVLLQLRVFYAREQPWIPILFIVAITTVKIVASLFAPHMTSDPELVAGYLGLANGLGFVAGAILGYFLLRRTLKPPGGRLLGLEVVRTILVTTAASLLAGLLAYVADRLLGLQTLTEHGGGMGSLLRLVVIGLIMLPIIAGVLLLARVPEALAARAAVLRRIRRSPQQPAEVLAITGPRAALPPVNYPKQSDQPESGATVTQKGPEVSDETSGNPSSVPPKSVPTENATTKLPRPSAGDFQPDVPAPHTAPPVSPAAPSPTPGSNPAKHSDTEILNANREAAWSLPPREQAPREQTPPREQPPMTPRIAPSESREPAVPAASVPSSSNAPSSTVNLVPGAVVAGGRYRLLVFHGGPPTLEFWQALDTALDRQVALTFVDPRRTLSDSQVQDILTRTLQLSRISKPGVARVLDVSQIEAGGLVVAEWIRGGSLKEVADTSPSPIGGARAIQSLAAAAEEAHETGAALSLDHPSRIRVSIEGDVVLAFPATLPTSSPEEDIRGIGAALYALLIDRWPLRETGVHSGLPPADSDATGAAVEPRAINRQIPFQISAAAARAVQPGGGISTATTLLTLLKQATAAADRTELIEPVDELPVAAPTPAGAPPPAPARPRPVVEDETAVKARKRRNLLIGVGAGAAVLIVVLVLLATALKGIFGDVGGGIKSDELGLNPSSSQTAAADGSVVKPVQATVFSPGGGPDNPDQAGQAISGGSGPGWSTDTYTDPVPFPNFKSGIGLILQLPQATKVGSVTLNVPSTGTQVQIRSASSPNPASLEDTTVLTQATTLQPGSNTIAVNSSSPTSNLLVWISTMGSTDGKARTELSNIVVKAAS